MASWISCQNTHFSKLSYKAVVETPLILNGDEGHSFSWNYDHGMSSMVFFFFFCPRFFFFFFNKFFHFIAEARSEGISRLLIGEEAASTLLDLRLFEAPAIP